MGAAHGKNSTARCLVCLALSASFSHDGSLLVLLHGAIPWCIPLLSMGGPQCAIDIEVLQTLLFRCPDLRHLCCREGTHKETLHGDAQYENGNSKSMGRNMQGDTSPGDVPLGLLFVHL